MNDCFRDEMIRACESHGLTGAGNLKPLDAIPTCEGSKLCLGLECLERDLWEFEPVLPLIAASGVRQVRLQSGWQKTETSEGVYDFRWLDRIVDCLLAVKIRPFLCLCYGNRLYCEQPEKCPALQNGGVGHFPVVSERERRAWQDYVSATVAHFRGRIDQYEIWNEPDVSVFCRVDMPWQDAYMELVRLTAPVIRGMDPGAKIITCTAQFGAVDGLLEKGLGEYTDVHSFHGYTFYPEISTGESKRNRISHLRNRAPNLRFWRGEAGCPSYNDPKSHGALSNIRASEIKQAKFLLRHLLCDLENEDIELTSYFHAYDFMHFSGQCRYHYGLIRHEGLSRKPSFACFQVLNHLFDQKVAPVYDRKLSFAQKQTEDLDHSLLLSLHFSSFQKNGSIFFAYYLPLPIEDDLCLHTVRLTLPYLGEQLRDPIILDPYTGTLYRVSDPCEFEAPLTDYPVFILDRHMIEDMADIRDSRPKISRKSDVGQMNHE